MNTISTHVLDTSLGKPAKAMPLCLEILKSQKWIEISSSSTNTDGRVPDLLSKNRKLKKGTYRIRFNTSLYFKAQKKNCFYPYAEIVFEIRSNGEHYHVPLLISPYGYSTYRGS